MNTPTVSALLATNRPQMAARAMERFCAQNYQNKVIFFDPTDGLHGTKMNRLFRKALGEFAVVWDDDDFYAPDRISKLIQPMIDNPAINCVGTGLVYYVDERIKWCPRAWLYDNSKMPKSSFWIGAPAYRMSAYKQYGPWEDLKCGADLHFLRKLPRESIVDLYDPTLMVCTIHGNNAAGKQPSEPIWEEVPMERLPKFYARSEANGCSV